MKKYGLVGQLKAKEGKGEDLAAILLQASQLLSESKGCDLYIVGKDSQQADLVWVSEVWDSKEDHDNSLKVPAVRELISKAMPILDGAPSPGVVLEILGGKGMK